ncbi:hypothetical protein Tco_1213958 [Tanacetum coccineum]
MSADSAVTYTSVHSKARSWRSCYRVHSEPEHPEDIVPAEMRPPIPPFTQFFLAPRSRNPHTRAAMKEISAQTSTYHSLLPSGTPPLLPILDMLHLLEGHLPGIEDDERLAYGKEEYGDSSGLGLVLKLTGRAVEARVTVLEDCGAHRHKWQRQATNDLAVQHIMRTQALEAGARLTHWRDTGFCARDATNQEMALKQYSGTGVRDCSVARGALLPGFHEVQTSIFSRALKECALTWWNSHVMTVTHDVAYSMTWVDLRKKMMTKYCFKKRRQCKRLLKWPLELMDKRRESIPLWKDKAGNKREV